jgi:hypothetical protein
MGARTALIMVVAGTTATFGAIGAGAGAGAAVSPLQCGATVTHNVTLRSDLLGCPGDGLIIGAAGVKVDLHGFTIGGSKTAGSAGIRDQGYAGLQVVGGGLHATIQDFEVGVLVSHGATPSISAIATRSVPTASGSTVRGAPRSAGTTSASSRSDRPSTPAPRRPRRRRSSSSTQTAPWCVTTAPS